MNYKLAAPMCAEGLDPQSRARAELSGTGVGGRRRLPNLGAISVRLWCHLDVRVAIARGRGCSGEPAGIQGGRTRLVIRGQAWAFRLRPNPQEAGAHMGASPFQKNKLLHPSLYWAFLNSCVSAV